MPAAWPFANQVFHQTGSYFHTGIAGLSALLLIEDFILAGIHPSGPEVTIAVMGHLTLIFPTKCIACEPWRGTADPIVEQKRYASQPIKYGQAETGKFSEIPIVVSWDFFSIL
jgi:hypothetical protein